MAEVTLVTGGGRSGKSRYALERASKYARKAFVATATAFDGEMQERIRRHRLERGESFVTVEEPVRLASAVAGVAAGVDVVLVDCLTVWLGNLMHQNGPRDWYPEIDEFLRVLEAPATDVLVVTNEVGLGIIPGNELSRQYRDLAGAVNQRVAAIASEAVLMISGIPLILKGPGARVAAG